MIRDLARDHTRCARHFLIVQRNDVGEVEILFVFKVLGGCGRERQMVASF